MYKLKDHPLTNFIIVCFLILAVIFFTRETEADDIDLIMSDTPLENLIVNPIVNKGVQHENLRALQ